MLSHSLRQRKEPLPRAAVVAVERREHERAAPPGDDDGAARAPRRRRRRTRRASPPLRPATRRGRPRARRRAARPPGGPWMRAPLGVFFIGQEKLGSAPFPHPLSLGGTPKGGTKSPPSHLESSRCRERAVEGGGANSAWPVARRRRLTSTLVIAPIPRLTRSGGANADAVAERCQSERRRAAAHWSRDREIVLPLRHGA